MYVVVEEIAQLFGLYYQPTTFGDLIVWFVYTMSAIGLVAGIIKLMFFMAGNVGRIMR